MVDNRPSEKMLVLSLSTFPSTHAANRVSFLSSYSLPLHRQILTKCIPYPRRDFRGTFLLSTGGCPIFRLNFINLAKSRLFFCRSYCSVYCSLLAGLFLSFHSHFTTLHFSGETCIFIPLRLLKSASGKMPFVRVLNVLWKYRQEVYLICRW